MAPAEVGGEKQQERVKFSRGRRLRIAPGALRPRNDRLQKMRWQRGTWAPPYKGLCDIAGGQGRPPLRCCVTKKCVGEGALPLPRAGKSAKRRRWRMKRAGFEEVPRLADTTVAGNRLAQRWAREPRPYGALHGVRGAVDVKKLGGFLVIFNHLKILLLFCNFCVAFLIDLCYTKLR